ncbi:MAG TPA: XdhC family protein [Polyangia bacterium]|nr:XdhC family protein [Polyangia bacterium]
MTDRRLIVVGSGEVAEHLMRLADMLGYQSVMSAGDDLPPDLSARDDVVVTLDDGGRARDLLRRATTRNCGYIGLVAPQREAVKALLALSKERIPKQRLDRVAAPAGLGIGAQTPGEVAVAVAAEMVALRRQAEPRGGRKRAGPGGRNGSSGDHGSGSGSGSGNGLS